MDQADKDLARRKEQDLWMEMVASLIRSGESVSQAVASANEVTDAFRKRFGALAE